ncbi:MAG: aldehyde dehydrogenase family protein [Myxococcales bacterium]|nr:aldehyde dehydrogenase family protein [Myxococcales bacterium]MDH3484374.1 aldehyde dehydrogenase family protein [Myxococcales bacterium]
MSQPTAQVIPEASTNGSSQPSTRLAATADASAAEIERIFNLQQAHQFTVAKTNARERKEKLKKLHKAVLARRQDIRDAMYADFRKHPSEVDLTEIYYVTSEIKHAVRHLSKWMRPHRVKTPIALLGSSSHIHYEPKGVVLIISPWNFPVNLTFGPLVAAIAAGNCVMIKPSENTPHTSAVMKSIIDDLFDESEVAVVEGGIATSQAVLALPFNHIFFTGAPSIGKVVMEAAAKHLASVTLELGGKSPTIVDETANVNAAAKRIAWAKFTNNGQICIAPDYLFVHESKKDEFLNKFRDNIEAFYGEEAQQSDSYARIVNNRHFQRLSGYLDDAKARGATVVYGGRTEGSEDYIAPTVLTDVDPNSDIMTEEIFGPVLPVSTFKSLDEPIAMINSKEKPLALYIYSKSKQNIGRIIQNTRAGGTAINHSAVHYFNHNLPFGGSNNSGIGKGHGFFGFEAFSNARGVFKQVSPFSAIDLMSAPYNKLKQTLIDLSIKFF